MGGFGQFVLVLRDEDVVVQRLVFCELGVGVPAYDEVYPGEGLRHSNVVLVADV